MSSGQHSIHGGICRIGLRIPGHQACNTASALSCARIAEWLLWSCLSPVGTIAMDANQRPGQTALYSALPHLHLRHSIGCLMQLTLIRDPWQLPRSKVKYIKTVPHFPAPKRLAELPPATFSISEPQATKRSSCTTTRHTKHGINAARRHSWCVCWL